MSRAVLYVRDERPLWRPEEHHIERVRAAFPADWTVVDVKAPAFGRGDGGGTSDEAIEAVQGAEIYFGLGMSRDVFRAATATAAPRLRWVHTAAAGVGSLLFPEMVASDVVLTNSAGLHAPPMAETILGMILHFARGFDFAVRNQAASLWEQEPFERRDAVREVSGTTLGIVGFGGIGRAIAPGARALGMHVLATRRRPTPEPDVEILTGPGALDTLLERSDYLLLSVPSTPETRGLIGAAQLERMKTDAVLISAGRGDVLDEDALAAALRTNRIRGAALDVFRTEPLPAESPLWTLPNTLILPHVSPATARFWDRQLELMLDNIDRYFRGQPLRNVVDKRSGY